MMPGQFGPLLMEGLAWWLVYYPVLLGLVGGYSLVRPQRGRPALAVLNLLTAVAGLLHLLNWGQEAFYAWYSQVEFEQYAFINRATGPYWWAYWGLLPQISSQLFWWPRLRRSRWWSGTYALAWVLLPVLERLVVVGTGRHRDYLPSSWSMFSPEAAWRGLLGVAALGLLLWGRPWRQTPPR